MKKYIIISILLSCTASKPVPAPAPAALVRVYTLQEATQLIDQLLAFKDSVTSWKVEPDTSQYQFDGKIMRLKDGLTLRGGITVYGPAYFLKDSIQLPIDTTHGHGPDSTIHAPN